MVFPSKVPKASGLVSGLKELCAGYDNVKTFFELSATPVSLSRM